MITSVQIGTAAWINGLSVNDELIAIDDYRVTGTADTKGLTDLAKAISAKKVGDKIKVTVSRDGMIRNIDVTLTQHPGARYRIEGDKNATAQQMAIRKKWLSL